MCGEDKKIISRNQIGVDNIEFSSMSDSPNKLNFLYNIETLNFP